MITVRKSNVDCPQYAVDELNGHPLKLKDAILEQGGPTILNFRYPERFSVFTKILNR
jgi:hypothetical protein